MAGNGSRKMTEEKMLTRLKRLKAHIDKGNETSLNNAAKKYIKSSHFIRTLLGKDVVHINKGGFLRWNGLAVNIKLAKDIIDGAHKSNKAYLSRRSKKDKNAVPPHAPQSQVNSQQVDAKTGIDYKTLKKLAEILEANIEATNDNSDAERLFEAVSLIREDMVKVKAALFDLHMDQREALLREAADREQISV